MTLQAFDLVAFVFYYTNNHSTQIIPATWVSWTKYRSFIDERQFYNKALFNYNQLQNGWDLLPKSCLFLTKVHNGKRNNQFWPWPLPPFPCSQLLLNGWNKISPFRRHWSGERVVIQGIIIKMCKFILLTQIASIVQFRVNEDYWIKRLKTHLYSVCLDLKYNIRKHQ